MDSKSALKQAYKDLAIEHGQFPLSFKAVSDKAGIPSTQFVEHYDGLGDLAQDIWVDFLRDTLSAMEATPEFGSYGVREKLLSFYFTFFEVLNSDKAYVHLYAPKLGVWNYNPEFLVPFKKIWMKFVEELVQEGTVSGELAERMVISGEYAGWHWPQFMFLLNQ